MPATQAAVRHPGAAVRLARTPLRHIRISPPPLRTTDGHSLEPRHASWLELFFDLVFAGAVNQLAGTLQDHPDLITLARFALFFVPVWWLWVQFSFYADRHESDDASHRGPFVVAIVLCAGLAASASRAVSGDPAGFVVAFSAMRALQLLLYARARKHLPATRRLYGRYLICFGIGGALWVSSLSVGGPLRFAFWIAALAAAGPPRRYIHSICSTKTPTAAAAPAAAAAGSGTAAASSSSPVPAPARMLVTAAIMPALVNSISVQLARIPVLARAAANPVVPGAAKNATAAGSSLA